MCEHKWVSPVDLIPHACGYTDGDNAPQESIVVVSIKKDPVFGDVCHICGEIYGQPGSISPEHTKLVNFLQKLER